MYLPFGLRWMWTSSIEWDFQLCEKNNSGTLSVKLAKCGISAERICAIPRVYSCDLTMTPFDFKRGQTHNNMSAVLWLQKPLRSVSKQTQLVLDLKLNAMGDKLRNTQQQQATETNN